MVSSLLRYLELVRDEQYTLLEKMYLWNIQNIAAGIDCFLRYKRFKEVRYSLTKQVGPDSLAIAVNEIVNKTHTLSLFGKIDE